MIQQMHISQFKARLTAIYSLSLFDFKKGGLCFLPNPPFIKHAVLLDAAPQVIIHDL